MKKVVSIVLVIVLLMISLLLLSSGTVLASGTVASPHFQATATPVPPPARIPVTGGEADLSGTVLLIGAGLVLVAGGLVIHERRRTRA